MKKITQAERDAWLRRKDTCIAKFLHTEDARSYWHAGIAAIGWPMSATSARTKNAAIDKAIRAERKE